MARAGHAVLLLLFHSLRASVVRRFAIVLAFIAAAVITPTFDPVNQILVAVPIIVLYEFGILLARLGRRLRGGDGSSAQ